MVEMGLVKRLMMLRRGSDIQKAHVIRRERYLSRSSFDHLSPLPDIYASPDHPQLQAGTLCAGRVWAQESSKRLLSELSFAVLSPANGKQTTLLAHRNMKSTWCCALIPA